MTQQWQGPIFHWRVFSHLGYWGGSILVKGTPVKINTGSNHTDFNQETVQALICKISDL